MQRAHTSGHGCAEVRAALLAGCLLLPIFAAACGGTSLAAPQACPTATAIPPTPADGRGRFREFLTAQRQLLDQLKARQDQFLLDHPNRTFSQDAAFRPAVAKFIDQSVCIAGELRAIPVPAGLQFSQAAGSETAALDRYIALLQAGRRAVVTRNVTQYQAFYDGLGAAFDAVQKSFQNPLR